MRDIIQAAEAELRLAGLCPATVQADGRKYRCPVEGKPKGLDGEYRIYADERPTLVWRNYRTGQHGSKPLMHSEPTGNDDPSDRAREMWAKAAPALGSHPYLARKGIPAPPGLKVQGDRLVVPAYGLHGHLRTVQMIDGAGSKRFLKGGQVQECSFGLKGGDESSPLYLAEGLATGVSVWLALERAAEMRVCFSAGNLLPVATAFRQKYPHRSIIICADNDRNTPGNPGLTKARDAAASVGGRVALATFADGVPGTDFNDLHLACGLDEVRRQLGVFYEGGPADDQALRVLNLNEFIDWPIPPREHLLHPVLPEQGLVLLYAPRGLGKTYVALAIGLAVAGGRRLFSWDGRSPHGILYIDGEMPARAMQERLRKLAKALDVSAANLDNFTLITPDIQQRPMPNLATPDGQAAIEPYLKNTSLLIIDNIATLCRAGRENESESWLPVQGWLLDLRRRGISVLIVHHAGKNGDQRGTSAKEDIMDTVINLRRPKDYQAEEGARFEVHLTKARGLAGSDARPFEAQLCDDGEALSWLVKDLVDRELEMVKALSEQGLSVREVAEEMGLPKSTVHRLKQKLAVGASD